MTPTEQGAVFGLKLVSELQLPEIHSTRGRSGLSTVIHRRVVDRVEDGWQRVSGSVRYGYQRQVGLIYDGELTVEHTPDAAPEVVRLLVLGAGCTLCLHGANVPVLHATTVRVGAADIAVCGPSGVGKSTFTAMMLDAGATLVTDDVSALDGIAVRPGFGRVKLWPDALERLGRDPQTLPRVHPGFPKRSVEVDVVDSPADLSRIVVLERGPAAVERLRGHEAVLALLANHRIPQLVSVQDDGGWLGAVARVAAEVEVTRVRLPGPLDALRDAALRILAG